MECNRDEAIRAKEIAMKKMLNNDFEGAHKIALKARQLFPDLENISQLLAVCDVHCSAQKKINGAQKDLYGILQVESFADEATIRKQYRKLALVLHPDKNKFPGAESAFKLIGEANMVLSDKVKRSLHDTKCREQVRPTVSKQQNYQGDKNPHVKTQVGAQKNFPNFSSSHFTGTHHHQQPPPPVSNNRPSFWTYCPFCKIKYQYYRDFINRPLRCHNCTKLFIAYDVGAQGATSGPHAHAGMQSANLGSNRSQPAFFQQGNIKVDAQMAGKVPLHFSHQTFSSTGSQSTTYTSTGSNQVGGSMKTSMKENGHRKAAGKKEGVAMPKVDAEKLKKSGITKDTNKKRRRKMVVDSTESCSSESTIDVEKSADNLSPLKRSRLRKKLSTDAEDMQKKEVPSCRDAEGDMGEKLNDDSNSKSESEDNSKPEYVDCPDPEFSNFDKDKEDHCFAVDQIWACYDTFDSMPRFYAHIRKIYSTGFRLRITWLEANPHKSLEVAWADEGLPVACGKFVHGDTEETTDRLMFSHQVVYKKSRTRFSYVIYPKKGEIWALFKDWDIKWSSNPETHKDFRFEIVEVLSDFDNENGALVAYLEKVKGFVSVFQKTNLAGLSEHKILPNELFRFSHRIPSVKLSGTERAGVPTGSCELDTASLPEDLDKYYYSSEVNMEPERVTSKVAASCPQSDEKKATPTTVIMGTPKNDEKKATPTTGTVSTPKKPINSEGNHSLNGQMLNLRRSPRGLKGGDKNYNQVNANEDSEQSNGVKDKTNVDTPSKANIPSRQDGDLKTTSCNNSTKSPKISSACSGGASELVIHDFSVDRLNWKFHEGEIWALSNSNNGSNQFYAQIKKVEISPIRLHVAPLELCISSNDVSRPSLCGLFKASKGTRQIYLQDSFLHMVKVEFTDRNMFYIYPREQEIWALHNQQNADLECGDCDIVLIIENNKNGVKVMSLSREPGYKSVVRTPRIQRSQKKIMEISNAEFNRFSHRIPAFLFTEEKDGILRGCWELDPAAVPGLPLH